MRGVVFMVVFGCLAGQVAFARAGLEAISPTEVRDTKSGTVLRLASLYVPPGAGEEAARQRLAVLLRHNEVTVSPLEAGPNRYGSQAAILRAVDGENINVRLVREGHAIVFDEAGSADMEVWLQAEAAARNARLGLWQEEWWRPVDHSRAKERKHRFALVEGIVRAIAEVRGTTYLNFGENWRTDFTIKLTKKDRRRMETSLDIASLTGARVRVRGWVYDAFGPQIHLTNLHMLELLE